MERSPVWGWCALPKPLFSVLELKPLVSWLTAQSRTFLVLFLFSVAHRISRADSVKYEYMTRCTKALMTVSATSETETLP